MMQETFFILESTTANLEIIGNKIYISIGSPNEDRAYVKIFSEKHKAEIEFSNLPNPISIPWLVANNWSLK